MKSSPFFELGQFSGRFLHWVMGVWVAFPLPLSLDLKFANPDFRPLHDRCVWKKEEEGGYVFTGPASAVSCLVRFRPAS